MKAAIIERAPCDLSNTKFIICTALTHGHFCEGFVRESVRFESDAGIGKTEFQAFQLIDKFKGGRGYFGWNK
jgi:hypothetical protein